MQTNPRDITQTNEMISLIDDAIADSLGPDWTSFDAAHHVFQWLQDAGFQIVSAAFAEREARLVGVLESAEQAATVKENLTVQTEGKRNTARRWQSCKLRTKAK